MNARQAVAEALSAELNTDMTPEFMIAIDKFLAQLYLFGFLVTEIKKPV